MSNTHKGQITLTVRFKTPMMPNFVSVCGINYPSLDEALQNEDKLSVDVGALDDASIDALCENWTQEFRAHALARRKALRG